mgnify:CR=1 FL=1
MGSNGVMLLIIIICVILSGYFSATETAFSAINRVRIRNQAEKGNKRAALVLQLSDNYDSLLSTILIGNNIVNIGCSSLATILFVKLLGEEMGAGISTLVITVVVLIFGEISPKSIAKESPEKFAMFSAPMINGLRIVLTPINWMFGQWKKLLSCLFKTSGSQGITSEELFTIVEEAQEEGSIDKEEGSLLRSALSFDDLEAGDILTPRIDMEGIPVESTQEEAAEVFANTGYSRLPVYEETLDHIVGILYHKDFYNRVYGTDTSIREVMRPALFTTANQKIDELMQELQNIRDEVEPSEILLVVDAMTGQDAVNAANAFNDALGVTGVMLTKLDGDARGGAALSIKASTGKPIKFIGVGEKLDQIEPFYPDRMASRILGMGDVLTLIEKAENVMSQKDAEKLTKKFKENKFDMDDLLDQMRQIKKMLGLRKTKKAKNLQSQKLIRNCRKKI